MSFFFENRVVYLIMWQNTVERSRPQLTIWRLRIACWITKATNTHSGCVILFGFPVQQWLHGRASLLRYTYIACIVFTVIVMYITTYRIFSNLIHTVLQFQRAKNQMRIRIAWGLDSPS